MLLNVSPYEPPGRCLRVSMHSTAPPSIYASTWTSMYSIFFFQSTYFFVSLEEFIFKGDFASQPEVENQHHLPPHVEGEK